jgi:hypothetical protein
MFAQRADQGIAVLQAHLAVLVTGALEHQNISHSRNLETERGPPRRHSVGRRAGLLFDIAVGIELFEVGPKVVDLLIVLDAGENHFRARDFSLGILDVFLEGRLIPDDARILVGIGILVIRDATGLAAVQAILCRTDLVLRAGTDAMADHTFLERDFALGDILRHSCVRRRGN